MIQAGKLLSCPDQCAARVYALMLECWSRDFNLRPTFRVIEILTINNEYFVTLSLFRMRTPSYQDGKAAAQHV